MGVSVLLRLFISSNEVCNTAYALKRIHEQNSIFKYTTQWAQWSQRKWNIIRTMIKYGETFYRCHVLPPPPFYSRNHERTKTITKTSLYNFDPIKPHFYIVKLGFTGVFTIFLISVQKHRLWVLFRTAFLTSTHNLCFEQRYEKYQNFYLKTFSFWWWNFQYSWIGMFSWWTTTEEPP